MGGREFAGPNPEFGAYINYYLKSAVSDDVRISITDASDAVIRELTGPKQAGIHRVAWDLRTTAVGPIPIEMYGNPNYTNTGPLVLPGEYGVRVVAGGQEQTKKVRVLGDPLVQISDVDRKKLFDALSTATQMQSTATAAADVIGQLSQQLDQIAKTVKSYPKTPSAVTTAADNAAKQVADLRRRLIGGGGRGGRGGGGGGPAPLQGRINGLKGELIDSQSLPTAIQSAQLDVFVTELNDLVAQVNTAVGSTMPNLYKALGDSGIHPAAGQPIKAVTPIVH